MTFRDTSADTTLDNADMYNDHWQLKDFILWAKKEGFNLRRSDEHELKESEDGTAY